MRKTVIILTLILIFLEANAQTKLASIFGDHMVLQRNTEVAIWGTDSPNKKISISSGWGEKTSVETDESGAWKAKLKTGKAGGPYVVQIKGSEKVVLKDVLLGEVWLCSGQSNMEMPLEGFEGQPVFESQEAILNSSNTKLRLISIERNSAIIPQSECNGEWTYSKPETAKKFSAVAYFYGSLLQKQLGVPVGLISSNWGGTPAQAWTPEEVLRKDFKSYIPMLKDTAKYKHKTPASLFNGMINPIIPFTIKGAIWYQGEANRFKAEQYETLFPAMIKGWRDRFDVGDFPFYFVQLAPLGWAKEDWVQVQQAQLKTMLTLPNTGMAVTLDLGFGGEQSIHPPMKKEVGERLALWALVKDYDIKGLDYCGPVYKSMSVKEGKAYLNFDYAPLGVTDMYKGLSGFEIAGEDGVYHTAEAEIKKGQLAVWNKAVLNPMSVRYGWKGFFEASLFNTIGLPASSFDTKELDALFTE